MRGRVWVPEGEEVHDYDGRYYVRVLVKVPGVPEVAVDMMPRAARRLARSLDIAAELAEEREKS